MEPIQSLIQAKQKAPKTISTISIHGPKSSTERTVKETPKKKYFEYNTDRSEFRNGDIVYCDSYGGIGRIDYAGEACGAAFKGWRNDTWGDPENFFCDVPCTRTTLSLFSEAIVYTPNEVIELYPFCREDFMDFLPKRVENYSLSEKEMCDSSPVIAFVPLYIVGEDAVFLKQIAAGEVQRHEVEEAHTYFPITRFWYDRPLNYSEICIGKWRRDMVPIVEKRVPIRSLRSIRQIQRICEAFGAAPALSYEHLHIEWHEDIENR